MPARIDIIFDQHASDPYFSPTIAAVQHAIDSTGLSIEPRVVRTDSISAAYLDDLPDAVVIGPGSPYLSPTGAELVITSARERGVPLVGT